LQVAAGAKAGLVHTNLCILYDQMPRRENQSHQRGREEHFYNSNIAIVAAKNARERIGVINAKAFGGTCWGADWLAVLETNLTRIAQLQMIEKVEIY